MSAEPLILTVRLEEQSQAFFDAQREKYFPPERNYLKAHLTLFHQLPPEPSTFAYLSSLKQAAFKIDVIGLISLGAGVAYAIESPELISLRKSLMLHFAGVLIPQDKQGFRPHITIQNKVTPEESKNLLADLVKTFEPFEAQVSGLDVWTYLGGPWRHEHDYAFRPVKQD